ncbi:unnamed protein product, partial [Prorocentrum cordatum]
VGRASGSRRSGIRSGVKQGGAISPMLFCAGLELALSRWKLSLRSRGLDVGGGSCERLPRGELCDVVEILRVELRRVGMGLSAASATVMAAEAAQGKFHGWWGILTDGQFSIPRRLKLLGSVAKPTVLFGLPTLAPTMRLKEQLGVLQGRMLRLIAGWARLDDEDWNVAMCRMNDQVDRAPSSYPVQSWRGMLAHLQCNFAGQLGQ